MIMKPLKESRLLFFSIALVLAVGVNFIRFYDLNILSDNPSFTTFYIDYEEKSRNKDLSTVIAEEQDPFVAEIFKDKDHLMVGTGLYNFSNLPIHFVNKLFNFKGVNLWLENKVLLMCLGIGSILLVFLIADLFFGSLVALTSSVMMVFSPHIWITYNFCSDPSQPFNLFFSLLTAYFFLLYVANNKWYFIPLTGIAIGVNFLFFHVGSFLIPFIIFVFCAYLVIIKKRFRYIAALSALIVVAFLSGALLNYLHAYYFNLSFNPFLTYLKIYTSWGPTASHTIHGLVFLNFQKLTQNFQYHLLGVFINGKTQDWHYCSSPPSVPMSYNYLVSVFFVIGCYLQIKKRSEKESFFLIWFGVFFLTYSAVVFVRQKNIIGELPPIFILSASSIPAVGSFLFEKIKQVQVAQKVFIYYISGVLIVTSAIAGSFMIFYFLPSKNFYDGAAYMGTYKVYEYIAEQGYTDKTKIIFTDKQILTGNMMLRLFTEGVPQIVNLTQEGFNYTMGENKWQEIEPTLKKSSDKLFYCFLYYNNLMGNIYITDEYYRDVFRKVHPAAVPYTISALNGEPLWRIYKIE